MYITSLDFELDKMVEAHVANTINFEQNFSCIFLKCFRMPRASDVGPCKSTRDFIKPAFYVLEADHPVTFPGFKIQQLSSILHEKFPTFPNQPKINIT